MNHINVVPTCSIYKPIMEIFNTGFDFLEKGYIPIRRLNSLQKENGYEIF